MRRGLSAVGVLAILLAAHAPAGAQVRPASSLVLPSDADIRRILAERVNTLAGPEDGVGIVVGIVGPQGRRVVAYGHGGKGDRRPLHGDTLFEIGSVGKLFTALALADMVRKGEVTLADPVAKHLPAGVRIPERNGRSITLLDLATHTSGLPFMPDEVPVVDDRAAREYGSRQLYQFLGRCLLTRDPGDEWDYSNVGYWLLGQALASRAGVDYPSLLQTRVLDPLKLDSTAIPLPLAPKLKARLAVGHNAVLEPALQFYSTSIYAALGPEAGGLVSTVHDLLRLVAVATGNERSPLAASMAAMLTVRRPMGRDEQALGWVVEGKGDDQLITHEGGTWGYSSYVAWSPVQRIGVVVLSNQVGSVSDIARHLLRPDVPLERPAPTKRREIALAPALLAEYSGDYDAFDEGRFIVTRVGDELTVQLPIAWGLPRFRLRPASRTEFFVAELPIRVIFEADAGGHVNRILVYPPRGQRPIPASRIGAAR